MLCLISTSMVESFIVIAQRNKLKKTTTFDQVPQNFNFSCLQFINVMASPKYLTLYPLTILIVEWMPCTWSGGMNYKMLTDKNRVCLCVYLFTILEIIGRIQNV